MIVVMSDGRAAILDLDGTLVDSNYQHAIAWYRAFRGAWRDTAPGPYPSPYRNGRRPIRPGAGRPRVRRTVRDKAREAEARHFAPMMEEVACFEGATDLLRALHESGHQVVLATSARPAEVDHYLGLLDARGLADAWTTAEDVRATKPEPDLVVAAMEKVGANLGTMVGDSTWDGKAARAAGVGAIGILTGGFSERELHESGCADVYQSVHDLLEHLGQAALS